MNIDNNYNNENYRTIYLAGGCFWGIEEYFSRIHGVEFTQVGYANGMGETSYEMIKITGHAETVRVLYDTRQISLREILERLFNVINPYSINVQGNDRGSQYRTGIYYVENDDKKIIDEFITKKQEESPDKIQVEIKPLENFIKAEEYHQKYLKKNPGGYCHIDMSILEDERPTVNSKEYTRMSDNQLKNELTNLQYQVTQNAATEPPFENEYYDNERVGIYVDITSGEPLFLSSDKYNAGCGWPAFSKPIEEKVLSYHRDNKLSQERLEVRSRIGDAHLGHVFPDGPEELGGIRYCINSASLKFIPYEEMSEQGYGKFKKLLKN